MILVGQYDSPYVRRVAVSLHVLEMPYQQQPLSVFGDAVAMRKINPLGRVPSLVLDDGEVLIDSAAILDHLDATVGPEKALIPPKGVERRRALRTIALATGAMDKGIAIVVERIIKPASALHPPWLERCQVQLSEALAHLEAEASGAGGLHSRPSQTIITTACLIGYLKLRSPDMFPAGHYPKLDTLADAAEALPAFQATRPGETDTIPVAAKA